MSEVICRWWQEAGSESSQVDVMNVRLTAGGQGLQPVKRLVREFIPLKHVINQRRPALIRPGSAGYPNFIAVSDRSRGRVWRELTSNRRNPQLILIGFRTG